MKGPLDMEKVGLLPVGRLYIVDGREMDRDSVSQLNSKDIESINVLKGEPARAKYGETGKDGVIEIMLKHPGGAGAGPRGPQGVRVEDKRGQWTMVADSVEIGNFKVTAVNTGRN
jgi:outer membrane receptor protein involved in Fe transport